MATEKQLWTETADAHGYAAEYMYAVVVRRTLAIHHEECLGRPCADSGYF